MLALSARIQPLLRGHKYALFIFQRAVFWLGRKILFIAGGIWGISRRFWLSVELFFEGLTRIIVVVR